MNKERSLTRILTDKALHTVNLDPEKCRGCVTCMRRCPTEAIRVRNGKASVDYDRCIGCGECVRLCPHNAKLPSHDSWDTLDDFKYKIVLPAPSLYGQFNNLDNIDIVLSALLELGFDEVYEVGLAAEYVSSVTKIMLDRKEVKSPVISTACPAILELIMMKYHNLQDNLLPALAPVDVAAKLARERAIAKGIPAEDIGVYFISPCPAKVFALKMGIGVNKPYVDRVLSVADAYMRLVPVMNNLKNTKSLTKMCATGLRWGVSRGEANAIFHEKTIAADGVENCVKILEAVEDGSLDDIEFIELNACTAGCVGGVMNVENPFVARGRLYQLARKMSTGVNHLTDVGKSKEYFTWEASPMVKDVFVLDEDRFTAMNKLMEMENVFSKLPQVDCGLCGAPSCRAFAEDLASGVIPADTKCPRLEEEKNQ